MKPIGYGVQFWQRVARAAILRRKPKHLEALCAIAYLCLAQHEAARAALADDGARSEAGISAPIARAAAETLAGLFPAETTVIRAMLGATRDTFSGTGDPDAALRGEALGAQAASRTKRLCPSPALGIRRGRMTEARVDPWVCPSGTRWAISPRCW
jgi:hypothetical protein